MREIINDNLANEWNNNAIRTRSSPNCYVCGTKGQSLYKGMKDRLFGAPGRWNLIKCLKPECGLVWIDPMPIVEDIGKAYQNYYTHEEAYISNTWLRRKYRLVKEGYLAHKYDYYSELASAWKKVLGMLLYLHPGRRADIDFSVMCLPAQPNGRLLEIGCGNGQMLKLMQDLGWKVEGVDFDASAVEIAKAKGVQVSLGTLEFQKYPDDYFDVITMNHLIEHVHDPLQLLCECHRILKSGGRLVIVTPNINSWGHQIYKKNWLGVDPPRHLHIFTSSSLRNITERVGFQKLKISTTIRNANELFLASRSIQRVGKYVTGSPQQRTVRIWARRMQLAEWLLLKVKIDIGEEIALIGEK